MFLFIANVKTALNPGPPRNRGVWGPRSITEAACSSTCTPNGESIFNANVSLQRVMKCKCALPVGGREMPSSFSSPSAASAGYKHKTQISLVVGSTFILLDTGTQLKRLQCTQWLSSFFPRSLHLVHISGLASLFKHDFVWIIMTGSQPSCIKTWKLSWPHFVNQRWFHFVLFSWA